VSWVKGGIYRGKTAEDLRAAFDGGYRFDGIYRIEPKVVDGLVDKWNRWVEETSVNGCECRDAFTIAYHGNYCMVHFSGSLFAGEVSDKNFIVVRKKNIAVYPNSMAPSEPIYKKRTEK